eukprot:7771624-Pyramimonas_sp.AAC.1
MQCPKCASMLCTHPARSHGVSGPAPQKTEAGCSTSHFLQRACRHFDQIFMKKAWQSYRPDPTI